MGGNLRHPTLLQCPPDSSHHGDSVQYSSFVCPNCKEKKWRHPGISEHWSRKFFGSLLVVVVPTFFWVLLTVHWFVVCKQTLEELENNKKDFEDRTIQAGKLILSLNLERELTATFLTARSEETRNEAKYDLDMTRSKTDAILNSFYAWPGSQFEQKQQEQDQLWRSLNASASSSVHVTSQSIFRSRHLFMAFLNGHRSQIHAWSYFCDEIQFYTDLIDAILVWINRGNSPVSFSFPPSAASLFFSLLSLSTDVNEMQESGEYARLLLQSHAYLMSSLNYLGAEQALCGVYHSVVCLSRRETLYYANFSFAAEAFFRFYRQSFPTHPLHWTIEDPSLSSSSSFSSSSSSSSPWRWNGPGIPREWRMAEHRLFFPNLHTCRRELVSELDYAIMTGGMNDGEFQQQQQQQPTSSEEEEEEEEGGERVKTDDRSSQGGVRPGEGSQPPENSNSPCSYNRKNETKLYDTELVTDHELNRVLSALRTVVESIERRSKHSRNLTTVMLVSMCLYLAVVHLVRCVCSLLAASKRRKRASKARSVLLRRDQRTETSSSSTAGSAPLLLVMRNRRDSSPKSEAVSNHHHHQYQQQQQQQNYQRQSSTPAFADDDDNNSAGQRQSLPMPAAAAHHHSHHQPHHHHFLHQHHQTAQETLKKSDHQPKQVRIVDAKEASFSQRTQTIDKIPASTLVKLPPIHNQQQSQQLQLQQHQQQHQQICQQPQHSLLQTLREADHFGRLQLTAQHSPDAHLQNFTTSLLPAPSNQSTTQNSTSADDPATSTSIKNFVAGYKIATV